MTYKLLTNEDEIVAKAIVDSAYKIHRHLGPGLLESVYETCFCHELHRHGLNFKRQVVVPINYDGIQFESALRLDVIVDGRIICELKSVEALLPIFHSQLLSYLRLTNKRLGFLINFNVPMIRDGIKRIIL